MDNNCPIIYERPNGGFIKIGNTSLLSLLSFRQNSICDTEAGGIILGRFIKSCSDIVIDDITHPMPGDIRKRYYYYRRKEPHQELIEKLWITSNGTCNYLGEWHTHPEDYPTPSRFDYSNWKIVLKEFNYDSKSLFFVIVGRKSISIWEGFKRDLRFVKLKIRGD